MTLPPLYIPKIPGVNSANIVYSLSSTFDIVQSLMPPELSDGHRVVLPGNGSFGAYTSFLRDNGWYDYLTDLRNSTMSHRIVAICSGFQSICASSSESFGFNGLNFYPFEFQSLRSDFFRSSTAVNLGRSDTTILSGTSSILTSPYFSSFHHLSKPYYVHGYASPLPDMAKLKGRFDHIFVSSVNHNIFLAGFLDRSLLAVQFHPELSGPFWRSTLIKFLIG